MADQIEGFVRAVSAWVQAHNLYRFVADPTPFVSPEAKELWGARSAPKVQCGPDAAARGARLTECMQAVLECAHVVRTSGRALAEQLVAAGHDARGVLHVVHAADGGGGVPKLARLGGWDVLKVEFQQFAMGLRARGKSTPAAPDDPHHGAVGSSGDSLPKESAPASETTLAAGAANPNAIQESHAGGSAEHPRPVETEARSREPREPSEEARDTGRTEGPRSATPPPTAPRPKGRPSTGERAQSERVARVLREAKGKAFTYEDLKRHPELQGIRRMTAVVSRARRRYPKNILAEFDREGWRTFRWSEEGNSEKAA